MRIAWKCREGFLILEVQVKQHFFALDSKKSRKKALQWSRTVRAFCMHSGARKRMLVLR